MHPGHVEVLIGVDCDTLVLRRPDEGIVFAHIDVGKGGAAPELLAVAERSAAHPGRAPVVHVLPGTPSFGRIEEHLVQAADVSALPQQGLDLGTEPTRGHPVVIVPVRDQLAAGQLAGNVALGAQRQLAIQPHGLQFQDGQLHVVHLVSARHAAKKELRCHEDIERIAGRQRRRLRRQRCACRLHGSQHQVAARLDVELRIVQPEVDFRAVGI